jgi:hypothetical protein
MLYPVELRADYLFVFQRTCKWSLVSLCFPLLAIITSIGTFKNHTRIPYLFQPTSIIEQGSHLDCKGHLQLGPVQLVIILSKNRFGWHHSSAAVLSILTDSLALVNCRFYSVLRFRVVWALELATGLSLSHSTRSVLRCQGAFPIGLADSETAQVPLLPDHSNRCCRACQAPFSFGILVCSTLQSFAEPLEFRSALASYQVRVSLSSADFIQHLEPPETLQIWEPLRFPSARPF